MTAALNRRKIVAALGGGNHRLAVGGARSSPKGQDGSACWPLWPHGDRTSAPGPIPPGQLVTQTGDRRALLGPQQRLDRSALVHRTVTLRHISERQLQVENLTGDDLALEHKVHEVR